jgi:hypothetical protein
MSVLLDSIVRATESYIPSLNGLLRVPLITFAPPLCTSYPEKETAPLLKRVGFGPVYKVKRRLA